ncbi:MAG: hypothetical protein ACRYG8_14065 [Janthinobacterium lividum]
MDKRTLPRSTTGSAQRWPSLLTASFCGVMLVNLLLIYLAFEVETSSPSKGGDAAGNAMSAGFIALIEYAALFIVGVPALLFALIRRRGFRLAMVIVLGLNAFVLLMLTSFIHSNP